MITNTQINNIMNLLLGKTPFTTPDTLYIGLSITDIDNNGAGAVEPNGGNYQRVAVANNKTSFTDATNGVITNNIQIAFNESTADWGIVTNIFISDAAMGGNILYYDKLEKSRNIQMDSVLIFPIGAITFTLENKVA
jgi:hypothetical protein